MKNPQIFQNPSEVVGDGAAEQAQALNQHSLDKYAGGAMSPLAGGAGEKDNEVKRVIAIYPSMGRIGFVRLYYARIRVSMSLIL